MASALVSTLVSNETTKQIPDKTQNEIFNPNLEVDLDNEMIYINLFLVNLDLHDVPREKIFPPPLTKRLNIELEYLFTNKDNNRNNNGDNNRDNTNNTIHTRSV